MNQTIKKFVAVLMTLAFVVTSSSGVIFAKTINEKSWFKSVKAKSIKLDSFSGSSLTVKNDSGKTVTAKEGMIIYNGYTLESGNNTKAYLSVDDSKAIMMTANTKIRVNKKGSSSSVYLDRGEITFDVKSKVKPDEEFNVCTSNITMGILGTYGVVSSSVSEGGERKEQAGLVEGVCGMTVGSGEQATFTTITAGEGLEVRSTELAEAGAPASGEKPEILVEKVDINNILKEKTPDVIKEIVNSERVGEAFTETLGGAEAVEKLIQEAETRQEEAVNTIQKNIDEDKALAKVQSGVAPGEKAKIEKAPEKVAPSKSEEAAKAVAASKEEALASDKADGESDKALIEEKPAADGKNSVGGDADKKSEGSGTGSGSGSGSGNGTGAGGSGDKNDPNPPAPPEDSDISAKDLNAKILSGGKPFGEVSNPKACFTNIFDINGQVYVHPAQLFDTRIDVKVYSVGGLEEVVVKNGCTLTIPVDAQVFFGGKVSVEAGGTLINEGDAFFYFGLVNKGTVKNSGYTFISEEFVNEGSFTNKSSQEYASCNMNNSTDSSGARIIKNAVLNIEGTVDLAGIKNPISNDASIDSNMGMCLNRVIIPKSCANFNALGNYVTGQDFEPAYKVTAVEDGTGKVIAESYLSAINSINDLDIRLSDLWENIPEGKRPVFLYEGDLRDYFAKKLNRDITVKVKYIKESLDRMIDPSDVPNGCDCIVDYSVVMSLGEALKLERKDKMIASETIILIKDAVLSDLSPVKVGTSKVVYLNGLTLTIEGGNTGGNGAATTPAITNSMGGLMITDLENDYTKNGTLIFKHTGDEKQAVGIVTSMNLTLHDINVKTISGSMANQAGRLETVCISSPLPGKAGLDSVGENVVSIYNCNADLLEGFCLAETDQNSQLAVSKTKINVSHVTDGASLSSKVTDPAAVRIAGEKARLSLDESDVTVDPYCTRVSALSVRGSSDSLTDISYIGYCFVNKTSFSIGGSKTSGISIAGTGDVDSVKEVTIEDCSFMVVASENYFNVSASDAPVAICVEEDPLNSDANVSHGILTLLRTDITVSEEWASGIFNRGSLREIYAVRVTFELKDGDNSEAVRMLSQPMDHYKNYDGVLTTCNREENLKLYECIIRSTASGRKKTMISANRGWQVNYGSSVTAGPAPIRIDTYGVLMDNQSIDDTCFEIGINSNLCLNAITEYPSWASYGLGSPTGVASYEGDTETLKTKLNVYQQTTDQMNNSGEVVGIRIPMIETPTNTTAPGFQNGIAQITAGAVINVKTEDAANGSAVAVLVGDRDTVDNSNALATKSLMKNYLTIYSSGKINSFDNYNRTRAIVYAANGDNTSGADRIWENSVNVIYDKACPINIENCMEETPSNTAVPFEVVGSGFKTFGQNSEPENRFAFMVSDVTDPTNLVDYGYSVNVDIDSNGKYGLWYMTIPYPASYELVSDGRQKKYFSIAGIAK